jgi:formate dehydrogenase maturation protein FdhE
MKTRKVMVEARDGSGEKTEALLAICPECEGESFSIIVINGHNHLQCSLCETTFCQGGGQCGDVFCETK